MGRGLGDRRRVLSRTRPPRRAGARARRAGAQRSAARERAFELAELDARAEGAGQHAAEGIAAEKTLGARELPRRLQAGHFEYDERELQVSGDVDGDRGVTGTRTAGDADPQDFAAHAIGADPLAGLYEGSADCGRIGLIVWREDGGVSTQGACVNPGEPTEQVHPILPVALEGGAIRVEVAGVESRVRPACPPPRE